MKRICRALLILASMTVLLLINVSCNKRADSAASEDGAAQSVLDRANTMQRLVEGSAPHISATGKAPGFVVDAAWPKPLPHNWRIGQIGGIFVDGHDDIWVIHRPRSLANAETGALDAVAKDAKGIPVDGLGDPRPNGRYSACCVPAPSVLEFDKQ